MPSCDDPETVFAATTLLAPAVADLAKAYGSQFGMLATSPQDALRLLIGGAALGWAGAAIAAARHLRSIEPRA